jgi:hypothetical protein
MNQEVLLMRPFRSLRWLLPALFLSLLPASSHAQISISVGFAPPELPVYEQPYCPEPNLMWVPGYWAYGEGDYYWVPGAWVEPPYEGALWTPHYWGWSGGRYRFHQGYWGRHVGYYGGVNYGYGYEGIGFSGGQWRGREFAYNTAVMRVNETVVHTTYIDRTVVVRNTIVNDRHVAYNGGPGGIQHQPRPEERVANRDQHMAPTTFQAQHIQAARADKSAFAKANGGHPQNVVAARPLGVQNHAAPAGMKAGPQTPAAQKGAANPVGPVNGKTQPQQQAHPTSPQAHPTTPQVQPHAMSQSQTRPATPQVQPHAVPQPQARPATPQVQPHAVPQPQARPTTPQVQPHAMPQPQTRPTTPQVQPHAVPQPKARPATPQVQPHAAPQPKAHPAPTPKAEPKPKDL